MCDVTQEHKVMSTEIVNSLSGVSRNLRASRKGELSCVGEVPGACFDAANWVLCMYYSNRLIGFTATEVENLGPIQKAVFVDTFKTQNNRWIRFKRPNIVWIEF